MFVGGDPDKPMIIGALYNATDPSPFQLPNEKTRSGFRTRSSPGGLGFNERSFEDARSDEQIFLHAQKNLDEAALSGIDRLELSSDAEIHLKLGNSSIRVTKDSIELSAATIVTSGEGGKLSVTKDGLCVSGTSRRAPRCEGSPKGTHLRSREGTHPAITIFPRRRRCLSPRAGCRRSPCARR